MNAWRERAGRARRSCREIPRKIRAAALFGDGVSGGIEKVESSKLKVERKGEKKGFNAENTEGAEKRKTGTLTQRSQREEHRDHRDKRKRRGEEKRTRRLIVRAHPSLKGAKGGAPSSSNASWG